MKCRHRRHKPAETTFAPSNSREVPIWEACRIRTHRRASIPQFPWPSPRRTSGGQRIREHNLPREAFEWYIDLRKYGTVPHGGFGMGIERCVAWICGLEHIRETIAFPRMLYRLHP